MRESSIACGGPPDLSLSVIYRHLCLPDVPRSIGGLLRVSFWVCRSIGGMLLARGAVSRRALEVKWYTARSYRDTEKKENRLYVFVLFYSSDVYNKRLCNRSFSVISDGRYESRRSNPGVKQRWEMVTYLSPGLD